MSFLGWHRWSNLLNRARNKNQASPTTTHQPLESLLFQTEGSSRSRVFGTVLVALALLYALAVKGGVQGEGAHLLLVFICYGLRSLAGFLSLD